MCPKCGNTAIFLELSLFLLWWENVSRLHETIFGSFLPFPLSNLKGLALDHTRSVLPHGSRSAAGGGERCGDAISDNIIIYENFLESRTMQVTSFSDFNRSFCKIPSMYLMAFGENGIKLDELGR